jgi:hypothetical protein
MKKKDKIRKPEKQDYCLSNGQFLDQEIIHGNGTNFLGNIFKD